MAGAKELTVNEVETLKLVSMVRSRFQDRINSTKLDCSEGDRLESRKMLPNSQEEKSTANDQGPDISKQNIVNGGESNTHVKSEQVIDVNQKSGIDMRNRLIKIHEKVLGIEKEIVQKNSDTAKKINDIHELTISVDAVLSQVNKKLNELSLDNKTMIQALFDYTKYQSLSNLRKEERKEVTESERDDEDVVMDDNYVRDALKRIAEVKAKVEKLQERANLFSGNKDDLNYLDIAFKLLENIMKIDVIQAHDIDEIRREKREVIELADRTKVILDSNLIPS